MACDAKDTDGIDGAVGGKQELLRVGSGTLTRDQRRPWLLRCADRKAKCSGDWMAMGSGEEFVASPKSRG
jgi:hypothetical protein